MLGTLPSYTAKGILDGKLDPSAEDMNKTLIVLSPSYNTILADIKKQLNLLPPASAMAGVYTMVDNTRGVWKALGQCIAQRGGYTVGQHKP